MSWYTNPDWWSAIGQWVGGIGTLLAVIITMRQIKETKQLQLDLVQPELILKHSFAKSRTRTGTRDLLFGYLDRDLTITATNIKQTPVCIGEISLGKMRFRPSKQYRIVKWRAFIVHPIFAISSVIERFRIGGYLHLGQHRIIQETPVVMKSGEYRIDTIKLSDYKKALEKEYVVLLALNYKYTTKQGKSIYILLIHPEYKDSPGRLIEISEDKDLIREKYKKVLRRVQEKKDKVSVEESA